MPSNKRVQNRNIRDTTAVEALLNAAPLDGDPKFMRALAHIADLFSERIGNLYAGPAGQAVPPRLDPRDAGCTGKARFHAVDPAQERAAHIAQRGGPSMHAYQCPWCGFWHLGHSRGGGHGLRGGRCD